ncbi:MAG: calcium/sodium antiporter [Pseudomonadales bacterium]
MTITLMWLGLGLAALLVGGELTVRGATGLSRSFGVSPLFIGLTVVAFGSSAPELVVNVVSALEGTTDLAFGGVVGSNLANVGLVLALAIIIGTIRIEGQIVRREIPLLLLVTSVLVVLCFDPWLRGGDAVLDASDGLVLLALFIVFMYVNVGDVLAHAPNDPLGEALTADLQALPMVAVPRGPDESGVAAAVPADLAELDADKSNVARPPPAASAGDGRGRNLLLTLAGLALLVVGGDTTVTYASDLARLFDVPEVVIGLGIVAIGTSLPELVTTVVAAMRGQPDLAVGNVIGSNLFNTTFVLGISSLIAPLSVPDGGSIDLLVNLIMVGLLIPFAITGPRRLVRIEGLALLTFYLGYVSWRFF